MTRNYASLGTNLVLAYFNNQDNGIKAVEHALQEVIEQEYKDKAWWEVCKVKIFNRMYFDEVDPYVLFNEIVESCKEWDKSNL